MNSRIIFLVAAALALLGPFPGCAGTAAAGARRGVPVLMYHEISEAKAPGETVISPADFQTQMRYLWENGYTTISMSELAAFMHSGGPLPPKPIVLTFDDGWKNVLTAVPLLDKYNFKASFWIIAGEKGIGGQYVDWSDVRTLAGNPRFEIGSHTMSHTWDPKDNLLTWLKGANQGKGADDARAELTQSRALLEAQLKQPVKYLAWPCGWYNARLIKMAKQAGYTVLLTIDDGLNRQGGDVLRIRRAFVNGACNFDTFVRSAKYGRYSGCLPGISASRSIGINKSRPL